MRYTLSPDPRLILLLSLALASSSCRGDGDKTGGGGGKPPANAPSQPTETLKDTYTGTVTILGREFRLEGTQVDHPDNAALVQCGLVIVGDKRHISFATSGAFTGVRIQGDTIATGGHLFQVTATPGDYVVDSKPIHLPEGKGICFVDGNYKGVLKEYDGR